MPCGWEVTVGLTSHWLCVADIGVDNKEKWDGLSGVWKRSPSAAGSGAEPVMCTDLQSGDLGRGGALSEASRRRDVSRRPWAEHLVRVRGQSAPEEAENTLQTCTKRMDKSITFSVFWTNSSAVAERPAGC